jgi:hypothetical protein
MRWFTLGAAATGAVMRNLVSSSPIVRADSGFFDHKLAGAAE